MIQLLLLRSMPGKTCQRTIFTSRNLFFHEFDEKGGYKLVKEEKKEPVDLKLALYHLKKQFSMCISEIREFIEFDPFRDESFATDILWKFDGSEEMIDKWTVTCDSDYALGYSNATLTYSPRGKAVFAGNLNTQIVEDGVHVKAGFCNLALKPQYKSFNRPKLFDWSSYNFIVLRVRGDGRCYMVNIACKGTYDITWNDMYHYPMYTRGGPHWQVVKIPFSKFVFASKGIISDSQNELPSYRVSNFGITLADKISGQFKLEIDYIALSCDPYHTEDTAYEDYKQE